MANLTDIPWFADLWKNKLPKLLERREFAFSSLGSELILCGIECKEMTLESMTDLIVCDNPLLNGGKLDDASCKAFVWRLSIHYTNTNNKRYKRNLRAFRKAWTMPDWLAIEQCQEYIEQVFENNAFEGKTQKEKKKKNQLPFASYASALVDQLAAEYSWHEKDIMQMPIKRVLQYTRRIAARKMPDYEAPIPFTEERAKALKELNENKTNGKRTHSKTRS